MKLITCLRATTSYEEGKTRLASTQNIIYQVDLKRFRMKPSIGNITGASKLMIYKNQPLKTHKFQSIQPMVLGETRLWFWQN